MKPRLLIVTSHPIQYQVPWFRALHDDGRIELRVLFLCLPDQHQQGVGFGHAFEWDVPLLEGYEWQLAHSATGSIRDGWWGLRLRAVAVDLIAQKPDAVLITGWQHLGMLQCLRAAGRLGLPTLVRAESNGLVPLSALRRWKSRWILGKADSLLPIGNANRQFYEALGFARLLGPEVPYCVDNPFFSAGSESAKPKRMELRRRFDIPEEAFCLLFVGKFVGKKRPSDLLAALERLALKSKRPFHLLMVGVGPLDDQLKKHVLRNRLPVSFTGFLNQTEVPAAYAVADCLVLPSDYGETWGLVVNEAMACGLPAIVSDRVGCGPDLITDGETGFSFPFGDIEGLASRMNQILTMDPVAVVAMGENARRRVFTEYSIEGAVAGTVSAALQLTGAGNRGRVH